MLNIQSNLKYTNGLGENVETDCPQLTLLSVGKHYFKKKLNATTGDQTVALDDVGTIGYVIFRSLAELVIVTTPVTPTVTPQGTAGAATWSYKIVAKQADGSHSAASAAGTTTTGNANLTTSNFNQLTWTAVVGAISYDVYRTAHGISPSTDGLIATVTINTLDDTGLAGDSSTAPSVADDNVIKFGSNGTLYDVKVRGSGFSGPLEWNAAAIHYKAPTNSSKFEVTVIEA